MGSALLLGRDGCGACRQLGGTAFLGRVGYGACPGAETVAAPATSLAESATARICRVINVVDEAVAPKLKGFLLRSKTNVRRSLENRV